MAELVRLSMSIEKDLYDKLQTLIEKSDYNNRSEFLRDLIRSKIAEKHWKRGGESVGTITLVYDHHKRQLSDRLTHLQHQYHKEILGSMHVHLDAHLCVEAILVRGKAKQIEELCHLLQREKGVLHAGLSKGSPEHNLS